MFTLAFSLKKLLLFNLNFLTISALLMAGCAGTSPKANFYTLNSQVSKATLSANLKIPKLSIHIASVAMDETVDRPQLVIRTSKNQVEILEEQRWAQPLKNEISRIVAEHLGVILGTNKVTSYPLAAVKPDFVVTIQVQSFESQLNNSAQIRAYWTVRSTLDNIQMSNTVIATQTISSVSANSYDALIAAHNQNLSLVSVDIAKAIASLASRS